MKNQYVTVREVIEFLIIKLLPINSIIRYLYYVDNGYSDKDTQFQYLLDRQEFFNLKIV
jgi:hypothetical protein